MKMVDTRLQQLKLILEKILQVSEAKTFSIIKDHLTKLDYNSIVIHGQSLFDPFLWYLATSVLVFLHNMFNSFSLC